MEIYNLLLAQNYDILSMKITHDRYRTKIKTKLKKEYKLNSILSNFIIDHQYITFSNIQLSKLPKSYT